MAMAFSASALDCSHPDFFEILAGLGLDGLRHFVENIRGFVDPTPLVLGRAPNSSSKCFPKA